MEIIQVQSASELKAFIEFPYALYKNDPTWVAPLRSEQQAQFISAKNPMLNHCTFALFLARENGKTMGRISAFLDHLALEHWKQPVGLFGSFECINDQNISRALLSSARDWLKARGMAKIRGPWSFASQEWGLVVEGYAPSPVILAPYNPPYYRRGP
ncbi:MAG: hypothetical protein NTZ74_15670 [Chloroflexi bacterium]|nr:hypothetical protein [Chloroflexota bacterium]